jgi:hypothetical protein
LLSDNDLMKVQKTTDKLIYPLKLLVNKSADDDMFQSNLVNVAVQISGVSMNRIGIEDWQSPVFPEKPSLTLARDYQQNIHYLAAPEAQELQPFLDGLLWLGGEESHHMPNIEDLNPGPAQIMVLMAHMCPHCPLAVRSALMLAVQKPELSVVIVDALQFIDLADMYKVKSTPTIVINDGYTVVGQVTPEGLVEHLRASLKGSLTTVLDSMIKSGRAEDAAELLCKEGKPDAVLPMFLAKEFSTRMGALLTMEEALERNQRVLDPIIKDLIQLLTHEDIPLRGDTAGLLGKIGSPEAIPALEEATHDDDPDVREAAEEALQIIRGEESQG